MLTLFHQASHHGDKVAIREGDKTFTYAELLQESKLLASTLLNGKTDLAEARVAFLVAPGFNYVKTQWAIWQAGGVAVPIFLQAPVASVQYVLEDTAAKIIVVSSEYIPTVATLCKQLGVQIITAEDKHTRLVALPVVDASRKAVILYTSGTTSLPKGVVTTHHNIEAQISTLVKAWAWSSDDHTLCVLPLHHVHGIINVIGCSMWAGACCEFIPNFSATEVFKIFSRGQVNVFMAVPTIYFKLITCWETMNADEQQQTKGTLFAFRLMVCGSAALPVSVLQKWQTISGHRLLERYGMTEIGMGLSNPYHGERKAGCVGLPLEGVQVRLCDDDNNPVHGEPGEIQVKGDNVFREYWQRPEETAASFTTDGWFRTGDVAEVDTDGYYKILGRKSQDIIKSGGYKISALEIEEVLRQHPLVKDASVVGLPDDEWGEIIAAALVADGAIDESALSNWLRERLSKYKLPRKLLVVSDFPRNAMGKVVKNDLKNLFA
ncbi:MAG TPA: acyl-CoA synthetase [Chryseolinea sp.]|nr:acyl-CoA synthetase [Chryseolinea sp.]